MIKICDVCNKEFKTNKSVQKRCSKECSQIVRSQLNTARVKERRVTVLKLVRNFLGNQCVLCGYDKSSWALEAHHIDPETKSFPLGSCLTRSLDKLLNEAKKCILLCANCHREHHHGMVSTKELTEIFEKDQVRRTIWLDDLEKQQAKKINKCIDCNIEIDRQAERCVKCFNKSQEKIKWPTTKQLIEMVNDTSFSATGRLLGVSDNAVRKRIKRHPDK